MKNYIISNIITENEVYHRKMEYTCSICKSDKLPDSIFQERGIKSLISKFKMKETDLSTLINKCNCAKHTQKAHKLCLLLNIIYNFSLKCPECKTEYNISIKIFNNQSQKIRNMINLILVLFINLIIYGACLVLVLYPLIIKKNFLDIYEQKKHYVTYFFFAALIFLINTYLSYITISMFLLKNVNDSNNYIVEVKDINDNNRKKTDKHFSLLYKFFRNFYKTQIRYLITKKYRNIFISKGYGNFNKELQEMIIKNNLEIEKENEENNNGGEEILGLKVNKNLNKEKDENNNIIEKSNGNIDNVSNSDEENNNNKEDMNNIYNSKIKSNNHINSNLNLTLEKNNNNREKQSKNIKNKDSISSDSYAKMSEKSNESLKQKKKKIVIEIINTDKPKKEVKKLSLLEERKNQDNDSNKTKKSDDSNIIKNKNKKNENESSHSRGKKMNNKKFEESKESLNNNKEEKKEDSIKIKLVEEPNIFIDNEGLFVSTPFHNNGK